MPKKHRVKRQKYVAHLLKLEKERKEYLERRKRGKRSREGRNDGDIMSEARDQAEQQPTLVKRRRTEQTAQAPVKVEEGHADHTDVTPSVTAASSGGIFALRRAEPGTAVASPQPAPPLNPCEKTTVRPAAKKVKRRY